ncbi:PAS domain-containing sensor histidine kinase [bacterium D16-54]|nr:PAS domain-containing sensor histidine kinase [bacterium D16-54]RKJ16781.1 PAS domain-containing sensor histidine kinase [bacterium D16-56]
MIKWNKRYNKVALTVLLLAIWFFSLLYYIRDMKNSLWNQVVSEILEVTAQGGHAFEVYIEKDMQILTRIIKHLSMDKVKDEASIMEIVDFFQDSETGFTVVDLDHGILYGENGKGARRLDSDDLEMYERFAEKGVTEPYMDPDTGRSVIGGYQRFTFADGTHGIAQVKRRMSTVAEEFMLSFYDDQGFSYIANDKGDILIRSFNRNNNSSTFSNIFSVIRLSGNSSEALQSFSDSMLQGKEGVMRFSLEGEKNVLAFTPVEGSNGWYLIAIVPDAVVMKHADEILKSSQTAMILLGSVLVVLALFLYMDRQSQKKIMEKEGDLQYRERLFGILANNTNDVFLMFTTDRYQLEYISPNVERLLGISQEEVKKDIRVIQRRLADNEEAISLRNIKRMKVGSSVVHEGERIHRRTGEPRWFFETLYKTSVDHSERFVAVLSDRTQERKSELALRDALAIAKTANESKSVFLSNMSHDIRTPMNAIVGFAALLQRDAGNPEKVREYTRKITSSSQHLLGLINDVLDMSKIESGKTTLNLSVVSLAELVEELGAMMQPQAKAKHQQFKIDVYDIYNEEILGDRLRINQILINILSNAIKYTPEGGRIDMVVRQMPQNTKNYARFHFEIRDNGIGMSQEYLETIFQPFTRESTKKTSEIQGTGLGMAITKNLVELMGGTIEVESQRDKGTTFRVDLELRVKEQDVDPDFWKKHGVTKMLIVDDEEEICIGIQNVMADTGVQISYALGGQPAVSMAQKAQSEGMGYDLVMIDWQMPDISGIETARRIRRIVPSHVPVMILTAYDISRIEQEGTEAGIDGFLQKPFFLSNFRLMLDHLKSDHTEEKEAVQEQDNILAGKNILAAEDNELNAEILTELLEMAGASCQVAGNGREALEMFEGAESGQYDLILMDVQMPVMDGYEATRAIRGCRHPQAKTIPIIAMTANAFSEDVKDALDAGMDEHVAKPIDMERLKSVIKDIIKRKAE